MPLSPAPAALSSPDRYLFGFEGDTAILLDMDREAYRRSIFLDDRILPLREEPGFVPIEPPPPLPVPTTGWIFHVAHCGSTLLARALDRPDGGLVLREPLALRQLGVAAGAAGPAWQQRLTLATAMFGRRYGEHPTIIKGNVPVNFMLPALLDAATPAILLYFPLADYLAAVLRSDGHRGWVRRITGEMSGAIEALAGPLPTADAELAAALWLAQLRAFDAALCRFGNVRSLDAEALFNDPVPVLMAAATLFEQPMAAGEAQAIVDGPLFATYAKNPIAAFDNGDRLARRAASLSVLGSEMVAARHWLSARLVQYPVPRRLDRPLPGTVSRDLIA